jgi:ABC-type branched-subunit amino acid transport system ATPase component
VSLLRTEELYRAFGSLVVTNRVNLTVEPGEYSSTRATSPAGARTASVAPASPAPSSATTSSPT